jgi:TRAP-type C4-dicarboxylate transport system permease small subunit
MKTSSFDSSVGKVSSGFKLVSSVALLAIMILTCLDITLRYFFSKPIPGAYDAVSLLGAVLVIFSMPYTMLQKGHVAVEILLQNLSRHAQLVIETLTHLLGIALFLVLAWQSVVAALHMRTVGEVTPTLLIPFYPILLGMAVSFFILCLAILVNLRQLWVKSFDR